MEKKPLTFISSVWYLQTTLLWQYIFSVKRSAAVLHCISTIKLWCSKVAVFNFNNSVQYVRFTKMGLVKKRRVPRRKSHRRSGLATLHSGSCSLVIPYYCTLGDLLVILVCCICLLFCVCACVHICILCFLCSLGCFPLQLSPSVLWYCWLGVLTCKNRLPYNLYCVGGDVKHCTIQYNPCAKNSQINITGLIYWFSLVIC